MKNISVTVETLSNGNIRVTGRRNRQTICWTDGTQGNAKALLSFIMSQTCSDHRIAEGYDMTHIELNDAAQKIIAA